MTSDFKNTIHIVCRVEPIVYGFALLHTAPLVACGHINPSNLNNTHASKFFILVVRHTSPIYYNITSLQGPRIHLPDAYFLFCKTASHLTLTLFVLLCLQYGTLYLFTFVNPKHRRPLKMYYFLSAYPAS